MPGSTAGGRFWSPYREAITPYMNLHAVEAVAYFLDRLAESRYFRMLHSLIKSNEAEPVRLELASNTAMLLSRTFDAMPLQEPQGTPSASRVAKPGELRFQGIVLTHAVVKKLPAWLSGHPEVLAKLMGVWVSP